MMYIHMTFSKKTTPFHPLHSTHLFKIFFTPNPFHCLFAKSLWAGKKSMTFNPNKQNNNLTLLSYARAFSDILSLLRKQRVYKISAYS